MGNSKSDPILGMDVGTIRADSYGPVSKATTQIRSRPPAPAPIVRATEPVSSPEISKNPKSK